ncbi:MAG: CocE/NonD family hydrolase, partial [Planctomycetes bacterium]|nr:CocE/NonD family hydrolase [Planctomycetota bacterium]
MQRLLAMAVVRKIHSLGIDGDSKQCHVIRDREPGRCGNKDHRKEYREIERIVEKYGMISIMVYCTALLLCCGILAVRGSAELGVVVERDVPVPMRDGVVLRADVYRPDQGGPYPVLVRRTPYSKANRGPFDRYVKAGYIVVCQDVRGRYQSEGTWESFLRFETHDAEDGYDTVEWAAKLPGSTGIVGTMGSSYDAFLQWRLAPLRPPSLVAMSAQTIPARYTDLEGPGTIRPGRRLNWWITSMTPDLRRRADRSGTHAPEEAKRLWAEGDSEKWLDFLPWLALPREAFEDETPFVHHWLKHPHTDPWKLHEGCREVTVPNLDIVGWYDHCNGDMMLFNTLVREAATKTARRKSRLYIGPWSHAGRGERRFGNIDFGPDAAVDLTDLEIRWFDYWLKGHASGVDQESQVKIFVMGDNRWRDELEWPLKRAEKRVLHLASKGGANTPAGDGILVEGKPPAGSDHYTYDPRDPVPSLHGAALFTIPTDQRPLAGRRDVLVYQSEPLSERFEVTGNPTVELFASSSAPDTDFFVRLIDVDPDGLARDVSLGMVRARYRKGLDQPELLKPREIVRYCVRMNPTSNAFLPGHRIRIDV